MTTVLCNLAYMILQNNLMRVNYSVNFHQHLISNQILIFAGYVLPNQSARKLEQALCCVAIYQGNLAIQKSKNVLKRSILLNPTTFSVCAVSNR